MTADEKAAASEARGFLERWRIQDEPLKGEQERQKFLVEMLIERGLKLTEEHAKALAERARSDSVADLLLRQMAAAAIMRQKSLSLPIAIYISDILLKSRDRKRKRGQSTYKFESRDATIVAAVWLVTLHGFNVTRNDASRKNGVESACSIVAHALSELRRAISEDAVAKIWQKNPHAQALRDIQRYESKERVAEVRRDLLES